MRFVEDIMLPFLVPPPPPPPPPPCVPSIAAEGSTDGEVARSLLGQRGMNVPNVPRQRTK